MKSQKSWVSFCMSTYKRPELLKKQLTSLSLQTFTNFEVIISDNDPDSSAEDVVCSFNDRRFKFYHNGENLGMMKSFNKSIERATSDYIVMITDDDPVQKDFLSDIFKMYQKDNSFGVYAGFLRKNKKPGEIEVIKKERFAVEILDPKKTTNILWSSCVIEKAVAKKIGKIPDYGSPHLADNIFIVLAGSEKGAVIINKMYSTYTSHNTNFSKSNLGYYIIGCKEFYNTLIKHFQTNPNFQVIKRAINAHLTVWFNANIFCLKKYYTLQNKNKKYLDDIEVCARDLLALDFMRRNKLKYFTKNVIFSIKKNIRLL